MDSVPQTPFEVGDESWVEACPVSEVELEDVIRFEWGGRTFAIYRSPSDTFHATDGTCTHEHAELADGLVMGDVIECPKHNGQFNYKTGEAKRAPVCVNLRTYPVKVVGEKVFVNTSGGPDTQNTGIP